MENTTQSKTRIMIVDDHPIVREGYSRLIEREGNLQVCAEADSKSVALNQIMNDPPDLVIVDISLKDGSGLELIKDIKAQFKQIKMLAVSMHDENLFAERCIRAGALGFVNKQQAPEQLVTAIHRVLSGKVFLSSEITERMICRSIGSENYSEESPIETLSDRELEVFEQIGLGETTRQIAEKLNLSPKTVETYRENIKHKLNLDNATELIRNAIQWVLEKK
ncbi:MAG: DNA-binding response regulator [Gimesia sp.]|uniref:Response regulator transcription factor n=1 Tax=Gimesia benthica TaxID=2608982 RepID=A0A6I6A902_9PLAN|nr:MULTISPECIES: response regulator transcription factor [Gimesia]KAA0143164.1 response regulator transcription factor [Gimesia chilikensis]MBN70484.1 DNA-binding response regulator [Gimesia sp.]QGQ22516.1 response regulator transcription factor [Gimesia benthica]